MLRITKQDIHHLPIEHWAQLNLDELEQALEADPLHPFASWLLPQLVAWYGSWTLTSDGKSTVIQNCGTPLKRVLYMLSRVPRSLLVHKQIAQPEYARFTPLIALGFKRMQGVPYEFWRGFEGRDFILEQDLLAAIDVAVPTLGSARLLEIREQGLLTRTGPKAGQLKSAESTWSLGGIQNTELGDLPKLTQTMLCQCWLAHPKNRRSEMILDLLDWDRMPEPLVGEIFTVEEQKPQTTKQKPTQALPWD